MRSKRTLGFLGGLIVCLIAILWVVRTDTNSTVASKGPTCAGLKLKELCFRVDTANTEVQRQRGLSGRDNLSQDNAMVFTFDTPSRQCIWMRDMKFPIDIVWLDEQKKVLKIENNVAPETYPATFCADYTKYVVEINAGLAKSLDLALGDVAQL